MIKSKKMRLAGKVARMRENRNTYGNVVMKYPEVREFFEDIYIYIYIYIYWWIILKLILVNV